MTTSNVATHGICSCMSDETSGSPHSAIPRHEQRLELATGTLGIATLAVRTELQFALDSDVARRRYVNLVRKWCLCKRSSVGRVLCLLLSGWLSLGQCSHLGNVRRPVAMTRPYHHLFVVQSVHMMSCTTHILTRLHCQAFIEIKMLGKAKSFHKKIKERSRWCWGWH